MIHQPEHLENNSLTGHHEVLLSQYREDQRSCECKLEWLIPIYTAALDQVDQPNPWVFPVSLYRISPVIVNAQIDLADF